VKTGKRSRKILP